MIYENYHLWELSFIESVDDAKTILTKNNLKFLKRLFDSDDSKQISAQSLCYYFNAASELMLQAGNKQEIFGKIITMYAKEKIMGLLDDRLKPSMEPSVSPSSSLTMSRSAAISPTMSLSASISPSPSEGDDHDRTGKQFSK